MVGHNHHSVDSDFWKFLQPVQDCKFKELSFREVLSFREIRIVWVCFPQVSGDYGEGWDGLRFGEGEHIVCPTFVIVFWGSQKIIWVIGFSGGWVMVLIHN